LILLLQTVHFGSQFIAVFCIPEKREPDDEQDMISFLHGLYIMTFITQGREAVTRVTSLGDNLKILLNFMEPSGKSETPVLISWGQKTEKRPTDLLEMVQPLETTVVIRRDFSSPLVSYSNDVASVVR
jgi:hypothetical protein